MLRANWFVYATFWAAIVLSIGVTAAVIIKLGAEKNLTTFALSFLVPWSIIFPLAAVSWFCGGYVVVAHPGEFSEEKWESGELDDEVDEDSPRRDDRQES